MKYRLVVGDERERLLGSKVGKRFDIEAYADMLNDSSDGDGVAVAITPEHRPSAMHRFSRVARSLDR